MAAQKRTPEGANEDELKLSTPMLWFLVIVVLAAILIGLFLR
ncbi:MAG TPA: hypothetical protein VNI02_25060 [Blastocatellia bacterium]|jgi:hypothetical protein|nr:hypothetical protein [Blastocatellia bacterium]